MGTMTFQIPAELTTETVRELERAFVTGGPDNMPWPTQIRIGNGRLTTCRTVDESGYFVAPWDVEHVGQMMTGSATLMERARPYQMLMELARGKINQLRNQAVEWSAGGLQLAPPVQEHIHDAVTAFCRIVQLETPEQANKALTLGFQAANELVRTYIAQVFSVRQQHDKLTTTLGCRLDPTPPSPALAAELRRSCNAVCIPISWNRVEGEETVYRWKECDALVEWALAQGGAVSAGPLIDFSSAQLPDWLWQWERDVPSMATFMCRFVEAAIRRYRNRIRNWQLTAASNWATTLGLGEDELLRLTYNLVETARQVDSSLEYTIGISQPWGEYMAVSDRTHPPFIFADTLIRSGLNLAALDLELVMGVTPRGSYCRDLLETSRLLDIYALLGVPLRVTLGYPSSDQPDHDADPEMRVDAGCWGVGHSLETQADWAKAFGALTLCKPAVHGIQWTHLSDGVSHQFPNCGLIDAQGQPKPALVRLRELRQQHLR